MSDKVLVANRGEIACRILRTLDRLGIPSVAVHSEADTGAPHVRAAGEAVCLGPAPVRDSYLRIDRIVEAALRLGANVIHPGYGLLSENAQFASACEAAGIAFAGPTAAQMRAFGLKHEARALAERAGMPVVPGSGILASLADAHAAADAIGYPVLLKASAGGGGIGMAACRDAAELSEAYQRVARIAEANFGAGDVFLERWVQRARHVEVQIFGDGEGRVVALGDRDCSMQRRRQKVIEEAPAPGLSPETHQALRAEALRLAESVRYRSAGTVELLLDAETEAFYFLEVNARLQVEHPITEAVMGIDLVEWMIRLALGERVPFEALPAEPRGHAIECRIYAEDPARDFQPCPGTVTNVRFPASVRVDGWIEAGTEVTPYYDPLLAKIVAWGEDRDAAVAKLAEALAEARIDGLETNLAYLRQALDDADFRAARLDTALLARIPYHPSTVEVLAPGTFTTIQDYPGRLGYWDVGVPPSGPMDLRSLRLGNRIVGNRDGAPALEITATGPTLEFRRAALVCLSGAPIEAKLDGIAVPGWAAIEVPAGARLAIGRVGMLGMRAYLCVRGGFDVPPYLGSGATFTLGGFGGHGGRCVRAGDVLHLAAADDRAAAPDVPLEREPAQALVAPLARDWEVGVLDGPHGAPEFFTEDDIASLYEHPWEVHFHSDRTGVRLIGPRPTWARADGGEAGLHPSNIHDTAYAVGSVDFTGDMPVVLGPDGPSLGGFVCPFVVAHAELWKLGQLRPGDRVRFRSLTPEEARDLDEELEALVATRDAQGVGVRRPRRYEQLPRATPSTSDHGTASEGSEPRWGRGPDRIHFGRGGGLEETPEATRSAGGSVPPRSATIVHTIAEAAGRPCVTYRRSGDRHLLIEYGAMVLDLELRVRVEVLRRAIEERRANGALPGIVDLTPGVRSLQVHHDPRILPLERLLAVLEELEASLGAIDDLELPTRVVHLPLSWDDPATREAIARYMRVVRDDAPWCPSNIEFIRRVNGLGSTEDVRRIVFDARYLVLGLGDVYLGAPVATPLDPRHRLVTTKYNPARTWTPENAVGIGGAYLCIYGMEGPGGYQFVGRSVPMWNTHRVTRDFPAGSPWLLRFFDQIAFYPVEADELLELRTRVRQGTIDLDIEESRFSLHSYRAFLASIAPDARRFKAAQQAAFDEERARWRESGELEAARRHSPLAATEPPTAELEVGNGFELVTAPLGAQVWRIAVAPDQQVRAGEVLAVLEAMKTESPVVAPCDCRIDRVLCAERQEVAPGAPLFIIVRGSVPDPRPEKDVTFSGADPQDGSLPSLAEKTAEATTDRAPRRDRLQTPAPRKA